MNTDQGGVNSSNNPNCPNCLLAQFPDWRGDSFGGIKANVHVVGTEAVLRGAVICFYLSNEGLSLLENAAYLGLPIPDKLREILAQLHDRSKKEAEPTDKGEGDQDA